MAIEAQYLALIKHVLELRQRHDTRRLSALCLSYPDLMVSRRQLEAFFTPALVAKLLPLPNADKVWQWHGLGGVGEPLFDSLALLKLLGVDAEVIDIAQARGVDRIVDLNLPLPHDLEGRFDLVIDTGTCEHCFNVGQAFWSACSALAAGGHLIHAAPLNRYNHGFWNFNPTVYPDFLLDNGFKILFMSGMTSNLLNGFEPFELKSVGNFEVPADAVMFVVAERIECRPFKWPVQRKYRKQASQ